MASDRRTPWASSHAGIRRESTMTSAPSSTRPHERPDACPFCQSKAVGTLAKVVTEDTYWRCHACGEGWRVRPLAPQRLR